MERRERAAQAGHHGLQVDASEPLLERAAGQRLDPDACRRRLESQDPRNPHRNAGGGGGPRRSHGRGAGTERAQALVTSARALRPGELLDDRGRGAPAPHALGDDAPAPRGPPSLGHVAQQLERRLNDPRSAPAPAEQARGQLAGGARSCRQAQGGIVGIGQQHRVRFGQRNHRPPDRRRPGRARERAHEPGQLCGRHDDPGVQRMAGDAAGLERRAVEHDDSLGPHAGVEHLDPADPLDPIARAPCEARHAVLEPADVERRRGLEPSAICGAHGSTPTER